ncbi:MAG TPA: phosphoadenylyl-sulfate reductase [Paenalcaligenes hominis]|uniref:Adenosine 5'-phosphosulfate reductase n=2 Tax=Paenalcaligenes hominis TaxID=643674 RepID=A0A9D3ABB5_9BURK|nr:phosphoadenylyl-sulfate reductase [Paenalcaligenes hominis]NJB65171.1 phosphoadenosine phosphosulfate reductase [Paenalcaligenes hominis]GGE56046.1 phosphoadenosine phosphosulfate reductase [Paenalcaligenes hominis]HJH24546.1 phosphoadenylyl-sulfate reductase [Paenalcaligenes hominis]
MTMTPLAPVHFWKIPPSTAADMARLPSLVADLEHDLTQWAHQFHRLSLAHSLAIEDVIITDALVRLGLTVDAFVLNTGKLHPESLHYFTLLRAQYATISWLEYTPDLSQLDRFADEYDFSDIYRHLDARKACCYARKIAPLQRALVSYDAWLTGQRREQATTRAQLLKHEWDATHGLAKLNPLAAWTQHDIWAYAAHYDLPRHPLYAQGIPSIGCEPCTKPIRQDEDLRAGRWWWESQDSKECGLHTT